MPSASRIVIAAAGGGKTTRVVDQALDADTGITALVTYTRNNVREIQLKMHERSRAIPPHVEVISWYTFLLHELARPYQSAMHTHRIDGIFWTEGKSVIYAPETNTSAHYFSNDRLIYSDKVSKFICACDAKSGGAVMRRLRQRFAPIIIDEIQDMAGYDLELLELMLKSNVRVTFVGDHRQATFVTNNAPKNKAFRGPAIIKKFENWGKAGLVSIDYECETHRCNQALATWATASFPPSPRPNP